MKGPVKKQSFRKDLIELLWAGPKMQDTYDGTFRDPKGGCPILAPIGEHALPSPSSPATQPIGPEASPVRAVVPHPRQKHRFPRGGHHRNSRFALYLHLLKSPFQQ